MYGNNKRITIYFMIICIIVALFSACSGRIFELNSPNGSMKLVVEVNDSTLNLSIFDISSGELLHYEDTKISANHKWGIKWYSENRIILDSSDIGPTEWTKQVNGSWKRGSPLKKRSPNEELILYAFWDISSSIDNAVTINIMKGTNEIDGYDIIQKIETDIAVDELIDCIEWLDDSKFVLKANDGNYYWKKQSDGNWERADE